MSQPGTKSPPCHFPKSSTGETKLPEPGSKTIKEDNPRFNGGVADIGKAPTSRVYTRDYRKVGRDPDGDDLVGPALGNPVFRI
jgi:hypothetical protein